MCTRGTPDQLQAGRQARRAPSQKACAAGARQRTSRRSPWRVTYSLASDKLRLAEERRLNTRPAKTRQGRFEKNFSTKTRTAPDTTPGAVRLTFAVSRKISGQMTCVWPGTATSGVGAGIERVVLGHMLMSELIASSHLTTLPEYVAMRPRIAVMVLLAP